MSDPAAGGLGRGLAAILTGPTTPSVAGSVKLRLIDSALTSLSQRGARSLAGYLDDLGGEPEMHLRSPEVRSLHPTQAFVTFAKLGDVAKLDDGRHEFELDHVSATALLSTTGTRRSMFFFGDTDLDAAAIDQLAMFCEVYAPVLHLHNVAADESERIHLVLDQEGEDTHAEVVVHGSTGFGSSEKPHDAIATACIHAVASTAKLLSVGEVRGDDGTAAFVVAAGEGGRLHMGAAPASSFSAVGVAVAVAALRAVRPLTSRSI